jgi:hypothetical protein
MQHAEQREEPETLAQLYFSAAREHSRKAALLYRNDGTWLDIPDWRLDRRMIRLGLFARERLGFQAGRAAVIFAPLSIESIVADLAVILSGGVSAIVDPSFADEAIVDAVAVANPDLIFVQRAQDAERMSHLQRVRSSPPVTIVFEGPAMLERSWTLADAMDLGGTLDTPERAVAFRARARAISPSAPALFHASVDAGGRIHCGTLMQGEACRMVVGRRLPLLARPGLAQAYVAAPFTIDMRLAFYGCLTNGGVTTGIGTPEREAEDRAELSAPPIRPRRLLPDRRLSP